ncbi:MULTISPECIES: efflux RND transporter periplasmic adaptor subunit [unclassified Bacteroides]|jgi:membrane fusion protein (multidrug efflux system)|uniref:efflux RND transporter periplasmic adaptor subunit n=1 Tax=unclassified Bacteroides TaxID=2646097 RepID=UPI000E94B7CE|nr:MULTISPECIES: efflux RND transporter periplasmic adaptor subunit [unclassified Bacteroides]RGN44795.1 efflux RND transporter periplasmic adaptor subunit [Bacteroides sp. OM05-12]RHR72750.1 efflux RND transporter periplasmic adaptor subunit [Bacteroides sp. AF16-49]
MNKKTKWGLIAFICIGLTGWGIYAFIIQPTRNDSAASPEKVVNKSNKNGNKALNVNALIISTQAMTDDIYTNGDLIPDEEVDLSFETSGKITDINFTEGSTVQKGQLLAKINDRPLQAQLKKLQAQLKLAEDRVFRQNALLVKDAVSKEAYEQVKTDLASLNADIDLIKANIQQTELRAPFDGIIGLRQVSVGSYASPTTIVAKLTKISPLKINFSVPERYAKEIKKGTRLTFSLDGYLKDFDATVYATESKVDPASRTLSVRALYPNTGTKLLPGRFASIKIKMHEIPNAIAIPSEAIVPEMGKSKVYLYKNGKSMPVEVKTGLRTDTQVQIINGLHVGDTIITSGTLQLRTGLNITLDNIK